ncbi:hypothetical protein AB8810_10950 [Xanthomonas sp. NCPPB 3005]|uniref:hypothetical protein n=1 Tax=Xanthomonas sp. NCPPB 3005 TaxID=3240913 RepID=UPI003513375F
MSAHLPSTTPTPGPFVAPRGTCTIWSANGDIQIAECKSRSLTPAGNVANAQLLALGASSIEHLRITLQQLADLGISNEPAAALVAKADAIGKEAAR